MAKVNITDDALRALTAEREREGKPQITRFDTRDSGFAVVVSPSTITFVVHKRVGADVHREKLGRWRGLGGDMSVGDARKAARRIVGKLEGKEVTPAQAKRASKGGPTLASACGLYVAEMGETDCRPTSIASVKREIGDADHGYLRAWLDRPLVSITGKECHDRHKEIASKNGPHVANRVMRQLRAIYNYVAKQASIGMLDGVPTGTVLPGNPTIAVKWIKESSKSAFTDRRAEPIADKDLAAWHREVTALGEPRTVKGEKKPREGSGVRRDYNLVVIYTGLRRTDAATLRWEHVNLTNKPIASRVWHSGKEGWETVTLHPLSILRPSPKGGRDEAFSLPITSACAEVLQRRRDENVVLGDNGWVFPARAIKTGRDCYACRDLGMPAHESGAIVHISEPKEDSDTLVSPHRLRDTYVSILGKLDPAVPMVHTKLLTNHSLGKGDVTLGYMDIGIDALRPSQQRVTDYLAARFGASRSSR